MASELQAVLEIAGVGTTLLFIALAGLIGLMYLLTAPRLFGGPANQPDEPAPDQNRVAAAAEKARAEAEEELGRQVRAVALAVATACADDARLPVAVADMSSDWRRLHRARRLDKRSARARVRS